MEIDNTIKKMVTLIEIQMVEVKNILTKINLQIKKNLIQEIEIETKVKDTETKVKDTETKVKDTETKVKDTEMKVKVKKNQELIETEV